MTAKDRYQAGRADLVYWLRSRGETLKRSGSEWEWKYHDERVTIRGHLWFDQYTQEGGDAVKFLQYFYGYSEEDAVAHHLGCAASELAKGQPHSYTKSKTYAQPKKEIELKPPAANSNMRRVFAYLCQTRGIAPEVVSAFAHARLLYESADKHNAVFVGRDGQGNPRHIHMRGTLTGSGFRQTLAGSVKAYSFHHAGTGRRLFVFEAPIDLLSYISLHPEGWQKNSYVALCGVGISPIERFLEEVAQLEEVTLCLDNDQAGHDAALRIAKQLLDEWEVKVSAHFPDYKDWNEELQGRIKMEDELDIIEIVDHKALFSSSRLVVPEGLYAYDLRDSDDGQPFATLEPKVWVNYGGTVLLKEPLDFGKEGYIELSEDDSPNFLGDQMTPEEFARADLEDLVQMDEMTM